MTNDIAETAAELEGYIARRRDWSSKTSMMSIPQPVIERTIVVLRGLATQSPASLEREALKHPGTARCTDPRGHEFMTWDLPADVGDGATVAIEVERMLLKCFEHGRAYQMEIVSNAMVDISKQRDRDNDHV
jgi:hypothetical protein